MKSLADKLSKVKEKYTRVPKKQSSAAKAKRDLKHVIKVLGPISEKKKRNRKPPKKISKHLATSMASGILDDHHPTTKVNLSMNYDRLNKNFDDRLYDRDKIKLAKPKRK